MLEAHLEEPMTLKDRT